MASFATPKPETVPLMPAGANSRTEDAMRQRYLAKRANSTIDPNADESPDALILDEQEQDEIIEKYLSESSEVDQAFKAIMVALNLPLVILAAAQVYMSLIKGSPGIPILQVDLAHHPFPSLAYVLTLVQYLGLFVLLVTDIVKVNTHPADQPFDHWAARARNLTLMRYLFACTVVAGINFALPLMSADWDKVDSWERVFWGVPFMVNGLFAYAVRSMVSVTEEVFGLEKLKYKLKGA
ncbi:hypothetical protein BCR44DRAFT_64236 [Catenaria anguillulae PL171]|uniref:Uncharacterized protein n=1 Tax=Catenaria anguillulae PL171 TaxID=765915 RepID=A0A1Y2HGT1_9FUNG|nr:hypothetical protein BCR44DRAFT_64236 [Catenaria anguillulae PL171]